MTTKRKPTKRTAVAKSIVQEYDAAALKSNAETHVCPQPVWHRVVGWVDYNDKIVAITATEDGVDRPDDLWLQQMDVAVRHRGDLRFTKFAHVAINCQLRNFLRAVVLIVAAAVVAYIIGVKVGRDSVANPPAGISSSGLEVEPRMGQP